MSYRPKFLFFLLVFTILLPGLSGADFPEPRETRTASTSSELAQAVAAASPGTHIILKDGTYTSPLTISRQGTEDAPIVIRAENRLKARFTAKVSLTGDYIIISGLHIDGPGTTLSGNYNRISRCRIHFALTKGACVFVDAGRGGRIDRNEMTVDGSWVPGVTGSGWLYALHGVNLNHANHFDLWIDRNYFHGWPSRSADQAYSVGAQTIIRIGSHNGPSTPQPNALVEYNLFEECHKTDHYMSKSIHFKTGGNTARYNTVLNSERSLITGRSGWGNTYYGNYVENSGGMQVFDADHVLLGNVVLNSIVGIEVMAGNTIEYDTAILQARAYNTLLAGNFSDKLVVGQKWSIHDYKAKDTTIEAHIGPVSLDFEENTIIRDETSREIPRARKLDRSMVGPDAPGDDAPPPPPTGIPASFEASEDAVIYDDGESASGIGTLQVGRLPDPEGIVRRALVRFEAGGFPPEGTIQDAVLTMRLVGRGPQSDEGPMEISLHRLLAPWSEGDVRSNDATGTPATAGSVTWLHRDSPDLLWENPGSDYLAEPSATLILPAETFSEERQVQWQGAGMDADIQHWIANPDDNYGWILITEESVSGRSAEFESRNDRWPTARPTLKFSYLFSSTPELGDWRAINEDGDYHDENGLGWVNIFHAPWVFIYGLNSWAYINPAFPGWFFLPKY